MSTTPRTDAHIDGLRRDPEVSGCDRTLNFCRQLETELAAAKLDAEDQAKWALRYLARAEKAEAKIITARSALSRIANSDYRGNRSTESQIAFAALEEIK